MINLASALGSVLRRGPTLAAVADHLVRTRGEGTVLVDANGPLSGHDLGAALAAAVPPGPPGLLRVPGHHDRSTLTAILAAASAGWDVLVVDPRHHPNIEPQHYPNVEPQHHPNVERSRDALGGRLWLGTSGTTDGRSRRHSRRRYGPRLALPIRQVWRAWELSRPGSVLVEPPLHHGHGLGFALLALVAGRSLLLPSSPAHRDELLGVHRPSVTVSVPTQLARLRPVAGWEPRVMITGSGPLSPALQQAVTDRFGPVLHNLFGSTEAGFATMATPADLATSPGCVGRPLAGVRLRVVGGLVEVDSPFATVPGRWIATGDHGRIDEHGLLHLLGRSDDILVVNGKNLTLAQIRLVALRHPAVTEAHVTAVPDPVSGHRVTVRVTLDGAAGPVPAGDVAGWLRSQAGVRVEVEDA